MRVTSQNEKRMGGLSRFLLTAAVLAAIVLAAGVFAARTDGARKLVGDKLTRRLGVEITVEKARIGLPYALVLENVRSKSDAPNGDPVFKADEIRIGLGVNPRWRIKADGCVLHLVRQRTGDWEPAALGRLGAIPSGGLEKISWVTEEFRRSASLVVRNSRIEWLDTFGEMATSAGGISFSVVPVKMADRRMYYHRLFVHGIVGVNVLNGRNVEREWLADAEGAYIDLGRKRGGPPSIERESGREESE